jgi:hypothetical protein
MRTLLDRIAALNGLIYLSWTPQLPPGVEAALMQRMQRTPDGTKCLWIAIHRRSHLSAALIPVVAHELQHAIEVLESGASSSAEIEGYFRERTNMRSRVQETREAQRIQQLVERELRGR